MRPMGSEKGPSWRGATGVALAATAALLAIALASLVSEQPTARIKTVELPPEIQRCSADADCVLLRQIGCCPCKSGGGRGAINAAQRDEWRRYVKRLCRYRAVCVRVDTCQFDLTPACIDGRCTARPIHG